MTIRSYKNDTIIAPLKCGTRFLDEIFGENEDGYILSTLKKNLFASKEQTIIVRSPMEHLTSALHTEIINAHNNTDRDIDTPVDILSIIDTFVYKGPHQTHQNAHWHRDLYETIYWYWRRNRKNVKIVDLKNLSTHLTSIGIEIPEHKKEDYNFSNFQFYCGVDELILYVQSAYPDEWRNLFNQIENATIFYNHLMNEEVIPIKLV
jgi:hypothetical protein